MLGRVRSLRRYPIKAMGGESLEVATLDARGLAGDRWWAVVDHEGRFAALKDTRRFRRHDPVVDFAAATGPSGVVVTGPDGRWPAGDPALDAALSDALGVPARLAEEGTVPHQDAGAVSLIGSATLAWCAARWDYDGDPRRLRVNVVVETDEPFVEESWVGGDVAIGSVTLRVVERVERCRTIDQAQDGLRTTARWLKPLAAEREMRAAVYADVVVPGRVAVGDIAVGLGEG